MQLENMGLLLLRVGASLPMAYFHGLPKVVNFASLMEKFPSPLGIPPLIGLPVTVAAEFIAPLLIALGVLTRPLSVLLAVVMWVAALVVHGNDPFDKMEKAFLFALIFTVIALVGPGKFALQKK